MRSRYPGIKLKLHCCPSIGTIDDTATVAGLQGPEKAVSKYIRYHEFTSIVKVLKDMALQFKGINSNPFPLTNTIGRRRLTVGSLLSIVARILNKEEAMRSLSFFDIYNHHKEVL